MNRMKFVLINLLVTFCLSLNAVEYEGEYSPIFSPDGRYLAYHKNSDSMHWDIVVKNLSTGEIKQITNSDTMEVDASWAPDGKSLVYAKRVGSEWDIYHYDMTSNLESSLVVHEARDIKPIYAPNGKSVVFLSKRNGSQQLYSVNISTKVITQLTDYPDDINHPAWSQNGKYVIFDRYFPYQTGEGGRSKIFTLDPENGAVEHLYSGHGSSIAGQLIGRELFVSNNRHGNWDILKINLDTGEESMVTDSTDNEMKAVVSQSAGMMAYSKADQDGIYRITMMALE